MVMKKTPPKKVKTTNAGITRPGKYKGATDKGVPMNFGNQVDAKRKRKAPRTSRMGSGGRSAC